MFFPVDFDPYGPATRMVEEEVDSSGARFLPSAGLQQGVERRLGREPMSGRRTKGARDPPLKKPSLCRALEQGIRTGFGRKLGIERKPATLDERRQESLGAHASCYAFLQFPTLLDSVECEIARMFEKSVPTQSFAFQPKRRERSSAALQNLSEKRARHAGVFGGALARAAPTGEQYALG